MRATALVSLVLLSACSPSTARALERPALLEAEAGCERWVGSARGNDPTVRIQMRLCAGEDGELRGQAQWSSLRSGWNVREVSGQSEGASVVLRDERIVDERPEPGWRFCTIDRWELVREGDRLEGTYSSAACRDRATVSLTLMQDTPPAQSETPPPSPPVPSIPATPPAPPSPPAPSTGEPVPNPTPDTAGCGCTTAEPRSAWPFLLLLVALPGRRRASARGGTVDDRGRSTCTSRRGSRRRRRSQQRWSPRRARSR